MVVYRKAIYLALLTSLAGSLYNVPLLSDGRDTQSNRCSLHLLFTTVSQSTAAIWNKCAWQQACPCSLPTGVCLFFFLFQIMLGYFVCHWSYSVIVFCDGIGRNNLKAFFSKKLCFSFWRCQTLSLPVRCHKIDMSWPLLLSFSFILKVITFTYLNNSDDCGAFTLMWIWCRLKRIQITMVQTLSSGSEVSNTC